MNWNEMWNALADALKWSDRDPTKDRRVQFMTELEQRGLTIMPLAFRQSCDLWGTATVTKTTDGYALVDPRNVRIEL
ncbi:MAG: hypothetical protein ACOYB2_11040 [Limnohabitans sp.]